MTARLGARVGAYHTKTQPGPPPFADDPRRGCANTNPDVFFPEQGDTATLRQAQACCRNCPFQAACLKWALTAPERFGVWGGLSEKQRLKLHRAAKRTTAHAATTAAV
jgi:WhiB family redox-sensing transcriptional regulator